MAKNISSATSYTVSRQYPTKLATNTFIGNQNQFKIIPQVNFYPAGHLQLTDIAYLYILSACLPGQASGHIVI